MSKAKVGVSMLYCFGEPFNRMVKRIGTMDTKYIEVLDDGTHELKQARINLLKEAAEIPRHRITQYMHLSQTSILPHLQNQSLTPQ